LNQTESKKVLLVSPYSLSESLFIWPDSNIPLSFVQFTDDATAMT